MGIILHVCLRYVLTLIPFALRYFDDRFAQAANAETPVNVAARVYRRLFLTQLGAYTVTLHFNNGENITAHWVVRSLTETRQVSKFRKSTSWQYIMAVRPYLHLSELGDHD